MAETKLQLVNSTLAVLGESALLNTNNVLGAMVITAINSALVKVVQETRASVFEQVLAQNVTNEDYLVSTLTLPDDTMQVYSVYLRISTGVSSGDKLIPLEYSTLEEVQEAPRYSVVGREVFISPMIKRPFTLRVHVIRLPQLPANDGDDSGIPDIVLPAVRHAAASLLYASYLDDANGASVQRNISADLIEKLRNQYGNFRAKSFNMQKALGNGFSLGGFSTVTAGLAYAPVDSPQFTGVPIAPTAATSTNTTQLATTAYVKNNLANYTTTANLTTTLANYLLSATAASTYAPLVSPPLTGSPTAPTQLASDNSTLIATTAFTQAVLNARVSSAVNSHGSGVFSLIIAGVRVYFGSSVVSTNAGGDASITYPIALSTPYTAVITNGDNTVTANSFTITSSLVSGINFKTGVVSGTVRVNWVASGAV